MFPRNLFGKSLQEIPSVFASIQTVCSTTFSPIMDNMELYPRRRPTEFYYDPQPLVEYQSRISEHPEDKLHGNQNSQFNMQDFGRESPKTRINPPRNSDMRMIRNSYFS